MGGGGGEGRSSKPEWDEAMQCGRYSIAYLSKDPWRPGKDGDQEFRK
jgi:hypothetical protein